MGAFNILLIDINCKACDQLYLTRIQFKFGDTWQYEYRLGGKLQWGGNDKGVAELPIVKVYGIAESTRCPDCQADNPEEYDIFVENDILRNVAPLTDADCYFANEDGNYCVIL